MEEKDNNGWGIALNGTATLGFGKDLKAQNRLKALELATFVYPNEVVTSKELVNTLKKRAEELLDWAYEKEEKEVNLFSEFGEDAELLNEWSKKLEECFESSEEKTLVLFLNDILKRRWK